MNERVYKFSATAVGMILLAFTAYRSWDFIVATLPADRWALAFFGLAALDGGLVAWLLSYLRGAAGGQRIIAAFMVLVDFLGVVLIFYYDTVFNAGKNGLVAALSQETMSTAMFVLSAVIAANVGAVLLHHMLDPETLRQQAEEEARAEIEDKALKEIRANSKGLALELAPRIAAAWRKSTELEYSHRLKKYSEPKVELPEQGQPEPPNPTTRRQSKD